MKYIYGTDLSLYVKERQAKQVRALRQAHHTIPKLMIVMSQNATQAIRTYVEMKRRYAADILIDVEIREANQETVFEVLDKANSDEAVHGIIVQLPFGDESKLQAVLDKIAPQKDVDGLGARAEFMSATAQAIDWLLAGNSISLEDKKIAVVGRGRLVGGPLGQMWRERGLDVTVLDKTTTDNDATLKASKLIVSGTGSPGILHNANVMPGSIVVDAGTASEAGVIMGDAAAELYERSDLIMTPKKGGVGPLTVTVMFDHVILAAQRQQVS